MHVIRSRCSIYQPGDLWSFATWSLGESTALTVHAGPAKCRRDTCAVVFVFCSFGFLCHTCVWKHGGVGDEPGIWKLRVPKNISTTAAFPCHPWLTSSPCRRCLRTFSHSACEREPIGPDDLDVAACCRGPQIWMNHDIHQSPNVRLVSQDFMFDHSTFEWSHVVPVWKELLNYTT